MGRGQPVLDIRSSEDSPNPRILPEIEVFIKKAIYHMFQTTISNSMVEFLHDRQKLLLRIIFDKLLFAVD
jgi:hypothetical protein